MFRLLRGIVGLAVLGVLAYGAVAVPLGDKTLWGHIKAIADSKEGKKLVDGVKTKAGEVLEKKAEDKDGDKGEKKALPSSQPSDQDKLTPRERRELKRLIRERLEKKLRGESDKKASPEAKTPAK